MASHHPYYRKWIPSPKEESKFIGDGRVVDLTSARLDEQLPDKVPQARAHFDDRAAAAIRAAVGLEGSGDDGPPRIWPAVAMQYILAPTEDEPVHFDRKPAPGPWFVSRDLLELKWYDDKAPTIHLPRSKCLALLAYLDYFPENPRAGHGLRAMVSRAILAASPGWCGTFGPGVDGAFSLKGEEGNYDMSEMHLLPMVYRHFDDLSPAARELIITQLLARGRIKRPRKDDTFTEGRNPNDWSRAGFVSPAGYHIDIGETENHILMILTARYLTNQLLYQRDRKIEHDNRRNGGGDSPSSFSLILGLLRNMLRGDFSEYNAKNYQSETRWALLNLCTYAYDHEIRLGARLVLDYISAHIAVSSNNLRRMVPFRRRFNDVSGAHNGQGFMTVGLLFDRGADPMAPYFAMQAGNVRAYDVSFNPAFTRIPESGNDLVMEVLSDYRMPACIQDLFVNDTHRRFFQRLHRTPRDEVGGGRNCDNIEIYASSPSYLITAGGAPAGWAVDPSLHAVIDGDAESQQLGVAVTTSFMATAFLENEADGLIQFGAFSRKTKFWVRLKVPFLDATEFNVVSLDNVQNYGVAPDFACGHQISLPRWVNRNNSEGIEDGVPQDPHTATGWSFVRMGTSSLVRASAFYKPGFYLAIYQERPGGFALMEAFDTWLHPGISFIDFKHAVLRKNSGISLVSNLVTHYTTHNNTSLDVVIWNDKDGHDSLSGATVLGIRYGDIDRGDSFGHPETISQQLTNGNIMNSPQEAKLEITNPSLGTTLTLDFSDGAHPSRFDSQTGEFEVAGFHNEVWLDFEFQGTSEGDVCRPFNNLHAAIDIVADRGVIRIVPGSTSERGSIGGAKSFTMIAPLGGVTIGTPDTTPVLLAELLDGVSDRDVWVQFDWPKVNQGDVPYLFTNLTLALRAVADGGVINIQPGSTAERPTIGGGGKRFTLVAPIGGVTIGAA